MSSTHETRTGDTFARIAKQQYGSENDAGLIRQANPGTSEPLRPGITLDIPDQPDAPRDLRASQVGADNEAVTISTGDQWSRFEFWDSVEIRRSVDRVADVTFGAPFEPDNPGFRETFRPFRFSQMFVEIGGVPIFRGRVVNINPTITPEKRSVTVSGYAIPGMLQDCTAFASSYPLEWSGLKLDVIARALATPFGISVVVAGDLGPVFDKVALEPTGKIMGFLADLARQRNLVITSNADGALVFQQAITTGEPVAVFEQGQTPLLSVTPAFNPQEYYTVITGVEPSDVGTAGGQHSEQNPHLSGVPRPFTFEAGDSVPGSLPATVRAKMGRMFGNMASYQISLDTWRTAAGDLFEPNTLIRLTAPGAMVYNPTVFLVRSVTLIQTAQQQRAEMNLVLPGAFSGVVPEVLPWDG